MRHPLFFYANFRRNRRISKQVHLRKDAVLQERNSRKQTCRGGKIFSETGRAVKNF